MKTVTNKNGHEIDYEASINLMDDEIREHLHFELAPCEPQVFFAAYEQAHLEEFGEEWFLSEPNPCW